MSLLQAVNEYRKAYEDLSSGIKIPYYTEIGSCTAVLGIVEGFGDRFSLDNYISEEIAPHWEFFSGDTSYPIPSSDEDFTPERYYDRCPNLWIGEQGIFRKVYCGYVASELEKFSEVDFLKWVDARKVQNAKLGVDHI